MEIIVETDTPPIPELEVITDAPAPVVAKEGFTWEVLLPYLLIALTPFLYVINKATSLYIWIVLKWLTDPKIDLKAKCPACGHRQDHKLEYNPQYECIIHTCSRCFAEWGQAPVVSASRWKVVSVPDQKDETEL